MQLFFLNLRWIEQKGMTFDHDFCYSFSFSLIVGGKRKGENNNKSRGQKSCLSARYLRRETNRFVCHLIYFSDIPYPIKNL